MHFLFLSSRWEKRFTSSIVNFCIFKCVKAKLNCQLHPLVSFCGLGGIRNSVETICRKAVWNFGSLCSAWREWSALIHQHDEQETPTAEESEKWDKRGSGCKAACQTSYILVSPTKLESMKICWYRSGCEGFTPPFLRSAGHPWVQGFPSERNLSVAKVDVSMTLPTVSEITLSIGRQA